MSDVADTSARMELPFIDHLHVDQSKIVGYLLNEAKSRGKAAFFRRLGFRVEEWAITRRRT